MTTNQTNINRRVYLTSIVAGVSLTAGCASTANSETPTPEEDTTPSSSEEPEPSEEENTCNPTHLRDEIAYVSNHIHEARRQTCDFIDDPDTIRAKRVQTGGGNLVIFPTGIYRGQYKKYILDAEDHLRRIEQNRRYIDQARDVIDRCDTPVPDALHGVLDDVEKKTDLFVSCAESFIAAAEIYEEADVYIVDYPGGSGIQLADITNLPDPAPARQHLLDAISFYEEGREVPEVPSDLETQIRYEAR